MPLPPWDNIPVVPMTEEELLKAFREERLIIGTKEDLWARRVVPRVSTKA
jgi:hypothetical protein